MADSGGGKGKAAPPPSDAGDGGAAPPAHAPEQSVAVKMGWCALRGRIPGTWRFEGLVIGFPNPAGKLPPSDNTLFVPMPAELIEGMNAHYPAVVRPVKGRLPNLHLFPEMTGNNLGPWSEYLEAHPVRSAFISQADFNNEPVHLPKTE